MSLSFIDIFSSRDPDPIKAEHIYQEMKDFKSKLRQQMKDFDQYSNRIPTYTESNFDSSLCGEISMETSIEYLKLKVDDDNVDHNTEIEDEINDNNSTDSDESQETIHENSTNQEAVESETTSTLTTLENIPNKKLLWSLNFKFVPQYIVLYRQSILFASDRRGFVRY